MRGRAFRLHTIGAGLRHSGWFVRLRLERVPSSAASHGGRRYGAYLLSAALVVRPPVSADCHHAVRGARKTPRKIPTHTRTRMVSPSGVGGCEKERQPGSFSSEENTYCCMYVRVAHIKQSVYFCWICSVQGLSGTLNTPPPNYVCPVSADGVVKLWDLGTEDGFPVADWREHARGLPYVCFLLHSIPLWSVASVRRTLCACLPLHAGKKAVCTSTPPTNRETNRTERLALVGAKLRRMGRRPPRLGNSCAALLSRVASPHTRRRTR